VQLSVDTEQSCIQYSNHKHKYQYRT